MPKVIYIKNVPDDLYYKVKGIMAELQADTWIQFLKSIVNFYEENKERK